MVEFCIYTISDQIVCTVSFYCKFKPQFPLNVSLASQSLTRLRYVCAALQSYWLALQVDRRKEYCIPGNYVFCIMSAISYDINENNKVYICKLEKRYKYFNYFVITKDLHPYQRGNTSHILSLLNILFINILSIPQMIRAVHDCNTPH